MRVFLGHIHHDAGVAGFGQFNAAHAADGKARERHVHAHHHAFRVIGSEHQGLRGLERAPRIQQVQARPHDQRQREQQQHRGLQLQIGHGAQGFHMRSIGSDGRARRIGRRSRGGRGYGRVHGKQSVRPQRAGDGGGVVWFRGRISSSSPPASRFRSAAARQTCAPARPALNRAGCARPCRTARRPWG